MRWITAALMVAMFLFVSERNGTVHAYLDPGTGSMALQLLIGGAVAALATIRVYWARIKKFAFRGEVDEAGVTEARE
jgi:hypothetical protein